MRIFKSFLIEKVSIVKYYLIELKQHYETSAFSGKNINLIFQSLSKSKFLYLFVILELLEKIDDTKLLLRENRNSGNINLNEDNNIRQYSSDSTCCGCQKRGIS